MQLKYIQAPQVSNLSKFKTELLPITHSNWDFIIQQPTKHVIFFATPQLQIRLTTHLITIYQKKVQKFFIISLYSHTDHLQKYATFLLSSRIPSLFFFYSKFGFIQLKKCYYWSIRQANQTLTPYYIFFFYHNIPSIIFWVTNVSLKYFLFLLWE